MATLTPLAKGLITIVILAGAGAAAWHLGGKEFLSGTMANMGKPQTPAAAGDETAAGKPPSSGSGFFAGNRNAQGPLGSQGNPLKVSLVSFHGYAPAILANGKSLSTQPGSIFERAGVYVTFVIQDDIPTLTTIFEAGSAQCAWRTSDFWAQEQPNLRNSKHDARAVMVVDNTQGGDAIIASDPAIRSVEDLADKSVALLQYTPSHGLVIDAVENSSLTARKKNSVKFVYVNAEEGTAGVRATLEGGNVQAAALWDPDLSLALKNVKGAHVVYSTKTATNLIYDVMVCDKRFLDDAANTQAFQSFVSGWLQGVDAARKAPDEAVESLIKTEEFFTLLAKQQGRDFIKGLFGNLVWTNLEDNARILGRAGGTNQYERVYRRFDEIYRQAGALANPTSPVINPQESFDYRFIDALLAKNQQAKVEAAKPEFTFSASEREAAARKPAAVTKPVIVSFASGASTLNKRGEKTIDTEMVPFIENNGSAYFIVSGNTDSTGARETNMKLSRARAQAVVDYLVAQWDFDRNRFEVEGNGPDKPICNEQNAAGEGVSMEECRALNRTTRVAVLSR